nr:carboxymuconolactone decarboxylase family protein [Mesorhizobium sp.]
MVQLRARQIVGSEYLTALHKSNLRKTQDTDERIAAVAQWKAATCFSEAERVALALVEAIFVSDAGNERGSDALYARASSLYDDKALATLAVAIGQVSFFIAVALLENHCLGARQAKAGARSYGYAFVPT